MYHMVSPIAILACLLTTLPSYTSASISIGNNSPYGRALSAFASSLPSSTIRIEEVTTKERALDVLVFRKWSISPFALIQKQREDGNDLIMNEKEAIEYLIAKEAASISNVSPDHFQFVALLSSEEEEEEEEINKFHPMHGVVGVVDARFRNHDHDNAADQSIPPNDVYIKNFRVHEDARRRGIGLALLLAVIEHVKVHHISAKTVTLDVDEDNIGAIALYERGGFVSQSQQTRGGFMSYCLEEKN